jgi:two-component system, chemotaxis family, chemotaxis protein CheY
MDIHVFIIDSKSSKTEEMFRKVKRGNHMVRILIADDVAFVLDLLASILCKYGHQVVGEAKDGKEAVDLYQKIHPELTLMDVNMPGMDGIEALGKIMHIDPDAKILMISAYNKEHTIREALTIGAKGFINKPFHLLNLMREISYITEDPKKTG